MSDQLTPVLVGAPPTLRPLTQTGHVGIDRDGDGSGSASSGSDSDFDPSSPSNNHQQQQQQQHRKRRLSDRRSAAALRLAPISTTPPIADDAGPADSTPVPPPDVAPVSGGSDSPHPSLRSPASNSSSRSRGSREYKCSLCKHISTRSEHLVRHVKTVHEGIKDFKCLVCGSSFGRKDEVMRHHRMHVRRGDATAAELGIPPQPLSAGISSAGGNNNEGSARKRTPSLSLKKLTSPGGPLSGGGSGSGRKRSISGGGGSASATSANGWGETIEYRAPEAIQELDDSIVSSLNGNTSASQTTPQTSQRPHPLLLPPSLQGDSVSAYPCPINETCPPLATPADVLNHVGTVHGIDPLRDGVPSQIQFTQYRQFDDLGDMNLDSTAWSPFYNPGSGPSSLDCTSFSPEATALSASSTLAFNNIPYTFTNLRNPLFSPPVEAFANMRFDNPPSATRVEGLASPQYLTNSNPGSGNSVLDYSNPTLPYMQVSVGISNSGAFFAEIPTTPPVTAFQPLANQSVMVNGMGAGYPQLPSQDFNLLRSEGYPSSWSSQSQQQDYNSKAVLYEQDMMEHDLEPDPNKETHRA
ncbi:hypothetical protein BCR33DRAFT_711851 [Rhizoclosmatium globosum]|uniref:C2H2-type domain-containing protein n=1 Tax=Rhizoclosmatium globosum TaxID=329046 RepID=A0A1Y2CZU1_9FUNG|nr:hypothetical protein BCR33DRAFT_711851 [Rhizoclosmatium globosum]|eukprot:ORY52572.1 hypothetical protein BCR33DRAFT_711851 [Rhizoclosmatium globosum]